MNNEIIQKIKEILNELRPFIMSDGGDIEFIKFENGTVYIKMLGACAGCQMLDVTINQGIKAALMDEIEEVKEVINIG